MKSIQPIPDINIVNAVLTEIGARQAEYQSLTALALNDDLGTVVLCFKLDAEEIADIARDGLLYVSALTFHQPFMPLSLQTSTAFLKSVIPLPLFVNDGTSIFDPENEPTSE